MLTGMAATEAVISRSKRSGMAPLLPGQGLQALAALLVAAGSGKPITQAAAVPADWGIILKQVLCCQLCHMIHGPIELPAGSRKPITQAAALPADWSSIQKQVRLLPR